MSTRSAGDDADPTAGEGASEQPDEHGYPLGRGVTYIPQHRAPTPEELARMAEFERRRTQREADASNADGWPLGGHNRPDRTVDTGWEAGGRDGEPNR